MTKDSKTRPLRVGLLGFGRIARLSHLSALSRLPGVEVAAVAELDETSRQVCRKLVPRAVLFPHHMALIEAGGLDAVVICLPPALHAEAAIASFERGLHVYLEKPLATTLHDGERVVRAWQRAGTTGCIGFNLRFHPLVLEMREVIRRGKLGQPVGVQTTFCAAVRELPAWKRRRASGGGVLLDLASHQFDLVRFVLDQSIVEVGAIVTSQTSEDDTAVVQLHMSAGAVVNVLTSLSAVEEHRMEISGTGGHICFDRYRSSQMRFTHTVRSFGKIDRLKSGAARVVDFPRQLWDALLPPRELSFTAALAAFVDTVRGGPAVGPDLHAGLQSLAVVLAAGQAAVTGHRVKVAGTVGAPPHP